MQAPLQNILGQMIGIKLPKNLERQFWLKDRLH